MIDKRKGKKAGKSRKIAIIEHLQPRVLYSADVMPGLLADPVSDIEGTYQRYTLPGEGSGIVSSIENATGFDKVAASASESAVASELSSEDLDGHPAEFTDNAKALVFIDVRTPDYQTLIEDLQQNNPDTAFEYVLLESTEDGLKKITDTLSQYDSVAEVHIISHGSDGEVQLGAVALNDELLEARGDEVALWSEHLTENADILIYGCNLAATESGEALVDDVARLTGADIAASDDLTGHSDLGGNWEFEYAVGSIDSDVVFSMDVQQNWNSTLQNFVVTTLTDTVDSNDNELSLREAIDAANNSAGTDTITLDDLGGSYVLDGGQLSITDDVEIVGQSIATSVIDINVTDASLNNRVFEVTGAEASFENLTITGGTSNLGGGIRVNDDATVSVNNVLVTGNSVSSAGAGIWSDGTLSVTNSTISNNNATIGLSANGGGLAVLGGKTQLDNVTINDNIAQGTGGGIFATDGSHDFTNITVSGNESGFDGGGGIYLDTGTTLNIVNATITDNDAASNGEGIYNRGTGVANISGSIIADNGNLNTVGAINDNGSNIIGNNSPGLALDVLKDNGGVVHTHALGPGSAGINGTNGTTPAADARGFAVVDGNRDIGAFEFGGAVAATNNPPTGTDNTLTTNEDTSITVKGSDFGFSDALDGDFFAAVTVTTIPTNGTLSLAGASVTAGQLISITDINNGDLVFTPLADGNGAAYADFDFQVHDNGGIANGGIDKDKSANTITFDVNNVNDAPVLGNVRNPVFPVITEDDVNNGGMTVADMLLATGSNDPVTDVDTTAVEGIAIFVNNGNGGTWQYSLDGGANWTDIGVVSQRSALLLQDTDLLRLNPNGVNGHSSNLGFRAWDQTAGAVGTKFDINTTSTGGTSAFSSNTKSAQIQVRSVDDAPVLSNIEISPLSYTEQDQPLSITSMLSLADIDDTNLESASVAVNHWDPGKDELNYTVPTGIIATYDAIDGTLLLEGPASVADFQSALRSITFANNSDDPSDLTRTFTFQAHDGDVPSSPAARDIIFTSVNDAPTGTDNTLTTNEDTSITVKGSDFGFSDALDGDFFAAVTVTTIPTNGTLSLAGAPVTAGQLISITDINNGDLVFTPLANASGSGYADFDFQVHDNGGIASGGVDQDQSPNRITFDVTPVNDVPELSGTELGIALYNENNSPRVVTGYTVVSDIDDTNIESATVSIMNFASGEDVLGFTDQSGITGAYDNSSGILTLVGTASLADYQNALRSITYSNASETPSELNRVISFTINDGDDNSNTVTRRFDVVSINDAPVLDKVGLTYLTTITEDDITNDGDLVSDILLTGGDRITDVDGDPEGIAIYRSGGNSQWEYSTDNGSTWNLVGAVSSANALLLDSTDRLRYVPDEIEGEKPFLVIRAWDQTIGAAGTRVDVDAIGTGGNRAFSSINEQVQITVTPINDAPVADDNTIAIVEDSAHVFTALDFGFSDAIELDSFEGVIINAVNGNGITTLNGNSVAAGDTVLVTHINAGRLIFTPSPNANGTAYAAIDFNVRDSGGTLNGGQNTSLLTNTITVDVASVNDAPVGTDNTLTTNEDSPVTLQAADFGFSDSIDGDFFAAVTVTTLPVNGTLSLAGVPLVSGQLISITDINSGNFVFTPLADGNGSGYADFDFQVHDNGGVANGGADQAQSANTITFDVNSVNDAPAGTDNTLTTNEGSPVILQAADFGFSDSIDGNFFAAVTVTTLPANGTLSLAGVPVISGQLISITDINNGDFVFTPLADGNGSVYTDFDFQVHDNGGISNGGIDQDQSANTIAFDVNSVNDAPAGADNTLTTNEDSPVTLHAADFGFSDSIDGDFFAAVTVTKLPVNGTLTLAGVPVTAAQTISITDINNGDLVFAPLADSRGAGSADFDFQVHDNGGVANGGADQDQSANTITFDVNSVNDAPAGTDNTLTTNEDSPVTLQAADFGFSDSIDGDFFAAVTVTTLPANGALTLAGVPVVSGQLISITDINSGNFVFTPLADGNGSGYADFDFLVHDNGGIANGGIDQDQSANTVTFDVTNVNDAPVGNDSTIQIAEDSSYVLQTADFGFSDPNDQPDRDFFAALTITQLPANGTLLIAGTAVTLDQTISITDVANNQLTFTPASNAHGNAYSNLQFLVHDNGGTANGGQDVALLGNTLTFDVTAVNDSPVGLDNSIQLLENASRVLTLADFGYNDIENDALLSIQVQTIPTVGWLLENGSPVVSGGYVSAADIAAGNVRYQSAPNSTALDFLDFIVQDNGGTADGGIDAAMLPARLTFTFLNVNNAPVADDNIIAIAEDGTHVFTANDFGFRDAIDLDSFQEVIINAVNGNGATTLNGNSIAPGDTVSVDDINAGLLIFTPSPNTSGAGYVTVDFNVKDAGGAANGGQDISLLANILTIDVDSVNDAPTGSENTIQIAEDSSYVLQAADFGFDDSGDQPNSDFFAALTITQLPVNGTLFNAGSPVTLDQTISITDVSNNLLTFTPSANSNGTAHSNLKFLVHDNGGTANGGQNVALLSNTLTFDVTAVNDAPVLSSIEALPVIFVEGSGPLGITGNLTLNDVDDTNIESANVSISGNFDLGHDVLEFTDQSGITGSYNPFSGVLSLSGSATAAQYQTALRSIEYVNTNDNSSELTRVVSFEIGDGDDSSNTLSRDIEYLAVNNAPELLGIESSSAAYTENDLPLIITGNTTVTDVDDTTIESATVSITRNFADAEDQLSLTSQSGITGFYDNASGTLTLNGSATLADYQAALQSITYHNTSEDPSDLTRTVSFSINDGDVNSSPVTRDINFTAVDDAPVLSNIELLPAFYTENAPPLGITGNLTLTDVDDVNIESATIAITGNFLADEDELSVMLDSSFGIAAAYDSTTGVMTLSGTSSVANYEAAIHAVQYQNSSDNPTQVDRTVTVIVNDGLLDSNIIARTLQINPINDAPTNTPVTIAAIVEDSGTHLITQAELLANASDIEGDGLTATGLVLNSGNGTLTDNLNGTWSYTPDANDDTEVALSYTVDDGITSVAGSATLDILPVNDSPTTGPVTLAAVTEDSGVRLITQAELLANAGDIDSDGLTATGLVINAGNGSLVDNNDGTWSFTPAANDDTDVSFAYMVTDGQDSIVGSATLDIAAINDSPVTEPATLVAIAEDSGSRLITQTELLANANDIEGDDLAAVGLIIDTGNGTLLSNGDGTWSYTPAADDDTDVSFAYVVTDGADNITGSATLDITPVNDAPTTALTTLAAISEDSGVRLITQAQLLANADDIEGDDLSAVGLVIDTGNGTLSNNNDGTWSYIPAASDDTNVSFAYSVTDGTDNVVGSALLDITPVNDLPTTTPVSLAAIAEDSGARLITQAELLANGDDLENNSLTATDLVIISGNGILSDNGDGTWSYSPATDDDTNVAFSYTVSDGANNVAGSATLDIMPVNDAPITTPVSLMEIAEDSGSRLITQAELLANANDIEGDDLTATGLIINAGNGTLLDNGDGTWSYTPADHDNADVNFLYEVTDAVDTVAGSATLSITPVNDAPEGNSTTIQTPEDMPYVLGIGDFPFADVQDGNDFSGIIIESLPVDGVLTLAGVPVVIADFIDARLIEDGALVFTPAVNHTSTGSELLEYLLRDTGGIVNGGIDIDPLRRNVTFNVSAINDAPQIVTNTVTVDEGGTQLIGNEFLSGSDVDDLPQDLAYTLESQPDNGALSLDGVVLKAGDQFSLADLFSSELRYVHDGSETSSDFVDLSLADGGEDATAAALGRLSFIINEVIDRAPAIENDQLTLLQGQQFSSEAGDLLASGFTALSGTLLQDNEDFILTVEEAPKQGTLEVDADGNFTYTHNNSTILQDEFTYRVTNEDGVFTLATVSISIEPPIGALTDVVMPFDFLEAEVEAVAETDAEVITESNPVTEEEQSTEQAKPAVDEFIAGIVGSATAEARLPSQEFDPIIVEALKQQSFNRSSSDSVFKALTVIRHNNIAGVVLGEAKYYSTDTSVLEVKIDTQIYGISKDNYLRSLSKIDNDFAEVEDAKQFKIDFTSDAAIGLTFSATVGVLSWVLRGGVLMASVMTSTPIWASVDPIRVVSGKKDDETADEVEDIFTNK